MSLHPSSGPTATGWSDSCRAGFAPAEEWRLVTAHGKCRLTSFDIRAGLEIDGTEIETLDLRSQAPISHRIDVPAESLGDGTTVVLTLNVEGTFVPAELTGSENRDQRELGAQVFFAFLEAHEEQ